MTRHYLDILAEIIHDNWDQSALTDYSVLQGEGGNDYTYGQMYEKIQWLCDRFTQMGIRKGDHIAICGANSANWAVTYLAVAAYQGVSVTMSPSQMPQDIVRCITFGDTDVLIVDDGVWKDIRHLLDGSCRYVLSLSDFAILQGDKLTDMVPSSSQPIHFAIGGLDDLAQICFTAGSTGLPKGVMLSYRNLSNNIQNTLEALPEGYRHNYVSTLPLSHAYGLMCDLICQLPHANRLIYFSIFSPHHIAKAFNELYPYYWMTIPMIFEHIFPHLSQQSIEQCQQIFIGGAMFDRQQEASLLRQGVHISVGYGTTETGPLIGATLYSEYKYFSVGKVVSGMECRISPQGEILVRGENVMLGYYKDEQATREKIDAEGWLHTGDRGHLDEDGYLYVEGRMNQDMIVLPSGENIHPENIETIINQVPGVQESLVLAREGKLIALVRMAQPVAEDQYIAQRNALLAAVNPQLPAYAQLFGIEFISTPLARTEKQTIKRYLYK